MLVAARFLDITASHMQTRRPSIITSSLLPLLTSSQPPLSLHFAVAAGVSLTHALLRHFRPSLKWRWLAGADSVVAALVAVCAAALGGAKGSILGNAAVAGCIVGIIAASSSTSLSFRDKK